MGKDHKKHKKDRKRNRLSSASDTDDEQSMRVKKRLEEERRAKKEQKRLQKEEMKANETQEEKRIRRMEKKARKEANRRDLEEDTLIPPELNYTNLNNPFNDTKLTQTFVWGKKMEKEGKSGLTQEEMTRQASQRIRKNLTEAAEFKRIRDSRAAAKEDMEMMKRDADLRAGQMSDSKEREFQLDQVKERTRIRIDQGRAKAIDLLTRYARFIDDVEKIPDFELESPIDYIKTSCHSIDDLEDLLEDIRTYRELDGWTKNETWWLDVSRIAEDEIIKRTKETDSGLKKQVEDMFKNKSIEELLKLEDDIDMKLRGNVGNKPFWQNVEDNLKVYIARKRIREHHGRQLRVQLARIREEQKREIDAMTEKQQLLNQIQSVAPPVVRKMKSEETEEEEESEEEDEENEDKSNEKMAKKVRRKVDVGSLEDPELDEQERERKWRALTTDQLEEVTHELYRIGCYSPPYNNFDDTMPGIEILDVQADAESLMEKREANRRGRPSGSEAAGDRPDSKMLAIARQGMEGDESTFSVEEQLETQKHLWSDKYRPRKPTYLNRVQTGFDWNKYNQTHYDQDNPPPKIVQGYKFNIFYPDLLDVTRTPTFTITPCDDRDFAVIRFKAGPPYEDIAFKVVNREWETLHKNGYKCQFQNGVFQLWFMFKKYRYRR